MGVIHRKVGDDPMWRWEGVEVHAYTSNNATKQVLVGHADGAHNFEIRYFTIPPHGFSSLDIHDHDHGVIIVQGRARVMLGERFEEIGPGDVVYIPGNERHQFENLTDGLMAFICIIPPKPIQSEKTAEPTHEGTKIGS
jgi:quercetin dioxygenase-like cupin family protein